MFQMPSKESIETLSALEIAEQMTYLDHQIFVCIRSEWVQLYTFCNNLMYEGCSESSFNVL